MRLTLAIVALGGVVSAQPAVDSVLSTISGRSEFIPGSLFTISGNSLSTTTAQVDAGKTFPTNLGGVEVQIAGLAAPLSVVRPNQIAGQIPVDEPLGDAVMTIRTPGGDISRQITIVESAPSLLLKPSGEPWLFDSNFNSVSKLTPGMDVVLYASGLGPTAPIVSSGAIPGIRPFARLDSRYTFRLQGLPSRIDFVGLAPGFPGIFQINAHIMDGAIQIPAIQAYVQKPEGFAISKAYPIQYSRTNPLTVTDAQVSVAYPLPTTIVKYSPFPQVCSTRIDVNVDPEAKPFYIVALFEDSNDGPSMRAPMVISVIPGEPSQWLFRPVPDPQSKALDFTQMQGPWVKQSLSPEITAPSYEREIEYLFNLLPEAAPERIVEFTPIAQSRERVEMDDNRLVVGTKDEPYYFGGFISPWGFGTRASRCQLFVDGTLVSEQSVGFATP